MDPCEDMRTCVPLLSLCLWLSSGCHATPTVRSPHTHYLRVVGGSDAPRGSQPWLVSLRTKGLHFCGGAVLSERWIMTAAHCFASVSDLSGVSVAVGEYDRRVVDEEEQLLLIKSLSVHEKYQRAAPMSYDVALVEVDRPIRLGTRVRPICLPLPDEVSAPGTSCFVGGWGRTKEGGHLPAVLREVPLDLVDPARCRHVLQTLKGAAVNQLPVQLRNTITVLCAGPERGGRDACQGDSGGPLVCPAASGSGRWEALGVTSWGKGCGRSWGDNSSRPPSRRGSPGVFADVRLLLPWIKQKLREADEQLRGTTSRLCSVGDGVVKHSDGIIRNPALHSDQYANNELCVWSIRVPPGSGILLEFEYLNLENDSSCHYDRLTVSAGSHRPVGIFCGSFLPGPVFLNNSQDATLLFSSDISGTGSGFSVRHRAVWEHSERRCGSTLLIKDEVVVHSPDYPGVYRNDCELRWVVHAPWGHVVKLDFADFDLEDSDRCLYDSLSVLGDVQAAEEIVVLCGRGIPPPVLSYHSVMVLHFTSDGSVAHRGFRATLTFISRTDLHHQQTT